MAVGISERAIDRSIEAGRLHQVHRGVYAVGHLAVAQRGRWMAAVLACGPTAALSHRAAGALRGFDLAPRSPIDVSIIGRSGRARPGVRIHRPTMLRVEDIEEVDGIRCTSTARTIVDLASVLTRDGLRRAVDAAYRSGAFDLNAISVMMSRTSRTSRPRGAASLRAVLAAYRPEDGSPNPGIEERFVALLRRHGLPWFVLNAPIELGPGRYHAVDVLFPDHRVAIELDSRAYHLTPAAFQRDRRIDAELSALGFHPLRFTWEDVVRHGTRTVAVVVAVLQHRERDEGRVDHRLGG